MSSGWHRMLLQNLCVPFSINRAPTDLTVTHDAMGAHTPPILSQMLAFEVGAGNNLEGPFPL